MPRKIVETPAAEKRLGELIDLYSLRSKKMISEFIYGRRKAKELIRDYNFIANNEYEIVDNIRFDYQWIAIYVGAESVRLCYLVEADRLVIFWYWRSNDPVSDPRLRDAVAAARK